MAISDTDPDAERVQLELLRRASVERRLHLALSLTSTVFGLAREAIKERMPGASDREVGLRFLEVHYGPGIADQVRRHLLARR